MSTAQQYKPGSASGRGGMGMYSQGGPGPGMHGGPQGYGGYGGMGDVASHQHHMSQGANMGQGGYGHSMPHGGPMHEMMGQSNGRGQSNHGHEMIKKEDQHHYGNHQ